MENVRISRHVVLTGPPGIGKTTLIQKVCQALQLQKVSVFGFYTEEIRSPSSRQRIGFKVVTTDGKMGTLANINSLSPKRVGHYGVEVKEFEDIAVPTLDLRGKSGILILDEIGKMELFSEKFKSAVEQAFSTPGVNILATIPVVKGKPIEFVERIRHHQDVKLFEIDKTNRNQILPEIIATITKTD